MSSRTVTAGNDGLHIIFLPFLSLSLAELEKEVHNIKSGLKALEAVSLSVCVTFPPTGSSPVCNYVLDVGRDGRQGEVFKCW